MNIGGFWNDIKDSMNKWRGIYQGSSGNEQNISNRIDSGKKTTIKNPTSQRTYHRGEEGSLLDQQIEIGDQRNVLEAEGIDSELGEVTSSAIKSVDYDPETQTASVLFQGGNQKYDYRVSPDEMREFLDADSKGQWLNEVWKYYNRMPGF